MSLYVNVGGVQQRGLAGVSIARVQVSQSVSNRNTAEVVLLVTGGATTYSEGQQVDIGNGGTRYFVGTIAVHSSRWINPRAATPVVEHTLSCVSLDQIASRRIVTITQIYENKSAGYIFTDLSTQFLGGENMDTSGVQAGPTFSSFTVEAGTTVYAAFDSIAERAGMLWDILGQIALPALRLYARGSLVSGWSIGVTSPIIIGGSGETGITVTTDRQGLANEVWVQVPEGPGDVTHQDFLGDGSDREFSVQHPIDSQPTITVDGIEKSVSLEGYIAAAWYYTPGSPTVRQDPTQPVLTSSNLLRVEYTPRVQVLLSQPNGAARDAANIAARSTLEATSGRYQAVIQAGDGATVTSATAAASAYLAAHKTAAQKLTIASFSSQAETLSIGETISVNLPALGVNANFLVEAVTRSYEGKFASDGSDAIKHTHSLSTGAVIGDWVTTFASAWSVGGGGTSAAGAVTSGGSSLTVQDLGTLTGAVASITPLVSGATGDMLMVAWRFGATVYSLTWGAAWTGVDRADYRAKANSKHAYLFIYALDTWNLIAWRTDY